MPVVTLIVDAFGALLVGYGRVKLALLAISILMWIGHRLRGAFGR
jgi:hypothetical protein